MLQMLGFSQYMFSLLAAEKTEPITFDPDLAIFSAIVFLLLLAILWKFAWRPIMEGLDKREQSIADQIEQAKQDAEKASQTLREYEAKLAEAAQRATEVLAEARKEAEAAKNRIVEEAHTEAERQRQRAIADIESAKNQAVRELAQKSVDSAVALAGNLVRQELNKERHARLIQDSLEKFSSTS